MCIFVLKINIIGTDQKLMCNTQFPSSLVCLDFPNDMF